MARVNVSIVGRLESLLIVAIAALVLQVFPSLWFALIWALDFRNWSPWGCLALTVAGLAVLLAVRFVPELWTDWRVRRETVAGERHRQEQQLRIKSERERLQALRRARSRRIY
jgi:hypothetical protein